MLSSCGPDFLPQPREARENLRVGRAFRSIPRDDENVHGWQLLPLQPERFADQAPHAIARDGCADGTNADGHADPRAAAAIFDPLDREQFVGPAVAALARALEIGRGCELLAGPQSCAP
jgi:hypothetical protein